MQTWNPDSLARLVDDDIPESASLEYKQELHLQTRPQRLEALKDLSGMGNGGGGTVLFGIAESDGDWPVATQVVGLDDRSLPPRLENIVREGIKPPLVATHTVVPVADGVVLAVDVEPSPLGPYMVEGYGERRYHRRIGINTFAMSETEVRDQYALAIRSTGRRQLTWEEHDLPLKPPTGDPWLIVSAVPQDPLVEVIDLRSIEPSDFIPPDDAATYLNNWHLADLTPLISGMTRFVAGYFSDDDGGDHALGRSLRLYRDGAAGIGLQLLPPGDGEVLSVVRMSRVLNGVLWYLGWLWERFDLRRPVELHLRLRRCDVALFELDQDGTPRRMVRPAGSTTDEVALTHVAAVDELIRAASRHALVRRFTDRIHHAFGMPHARYPFSSGELYGSLGQALNLSVTTDSIYAGGNDFLGTIHHDGVVIGGTSGQPVAQFQGGVLADLSGRVLGVLELATGAACPDAFVATNIQRDPRGAAATRRNDEPLPAPDHEPLPNVVPQWSELGALETIRGY